MGPAAFEGQSSDVTTASEIFISQEKKLLILQTRTPLTSALIDCYIKEIVEFVQSEKISELLILTSSYSHEQHFVEKNPFEFLANNLIKEKAFPGFSESSSEFQIPGCGYAKLLYQQATESSIPTVILYKFVSEGDNFFDGIQLCQKVNEYLEVIPTAGDKLEVKTPISWKFLFGRNVKPEIY